MRCPECKRDIPFIDWKETGSGCPYCRSGTREQEDEERDREAPEGDLHVGADIQIDEVKGEGNE